MKTESDAVLRARVAPLAALGWPVSRIAIECHASVARVRSLVGDDYVATAIRPRGFAALSAKRRSEVSRLGGKTAHAHGTAHRFTSEEARLAGRLGGVVNAAKSRRRQS